MSTEQRLMPKQYRSRERVHQILSAATSVIVAQGLSGLTTTEVARKAGITLGSLYRYFPNREAIVKQLAIGHIQKLQQHLASYLERLDLVAGIDDLLDAFLNFYRKEPGYVEIWSNMGSMPQLAELDREDLEQNTQMIIKTAKHTFPHLDEAELRTISSVVSRGAGAVLRLAMTQSKAQAEATLSELKLQTKIYLQFRLFQHQELLPGRNDFDN